MDSSVHSQLMSGARETSSPSHANGSKRASNATLSRQRAAAYCAHAPEPYAAMASRGDWSTELWDICAQPGGPNMCCLSLWCPCIQYGLLLEQLPPGSVTCAGSAAGGCALFCMLWLFGDLLSAALLTKIFTLPCTPLVHCHTRGFMRRKYGIQSHPLHDFLITWCCAPCALCQEARELVIRQAAEREDQARTPLLMSRSNSVHGGTSVHGGPDISARGSLAGAGRITSGLAPAGSAPEPASPMAVSAAATLTLSGGGSSSLRQEGSGKPPPLDEGGAGISPSPQHRDRSIRFGSSGTTAAAAPAGLGAGRATTPSDPVKPMSPPGQNAQGTAVVATAGVAAPGTPDSSSPPGRSL